MGAGVIVTAGLVALAVAMGIGRFAFTPILPMMREDAGVSVAMGGWLAAANYVGYLAGALTATRVGWRAGSAIRAGLATIAITTLAMGVTHHVTVWLLLRTVAGIASAWVLVHTSAWSMERLDRLGRPGLGGVVFAGVGVGIALAGLTCLALMRFGARSAHAWAVLGAASLVLGAAVWPVLAAGDVAQAAHGRATPPLRAAHGHTPDTARLVLCYGAFGFGYIIPATFLPVMAREVIADPLVFGWAWPLFGMAAAVSPIAAAPWSAAAPRPVWTLAQVVMLVGVVVPVVTHGLLGIALAALAVGGTFVVITMAGMQEARRVAGDAAPPLMAAMTAAFAAGQIVGPLCVSAAAAAGLEFAPALLLATAALAVSALMLGVRSARPR